jgi:PKD repeat protein
VQFTAGGLYSVTLTATNAAGSDGETKVDYILVTAPPVADFSADIIAPGIGQTVTFTDLSVNGATLWAWSFLPSTVTFVGGTNAMSQDPQVQFDAPGAYTVELTVSNAAGSDIETKTDYITVIAPPVADFTADNTNPNVGASVNFTDISSGNPTTWSWIIIPTTVTYLGGTTPGSQNPQVQFDAPGLYIVELTVSNASGSDTETKTDYIFVINPIINLDITVYLEGPFNGANMSVNLTNLPEFPLTQPYNIAPWNYGGSESVVVIPSANIVDWLLVELRDAADAASATSATMMDRQAAFLLSNGKIVGMDGASTLQFSNSLTQQLYVVIWHRNHLAVMSSGFVSESGGTYSYNFSTGATQAYGSTDAHKQIGPDVWGMIGGDGNRDGDVTDTDKSPIWESQSGTQGYIESDYNLDTQSDNTDKDDVWTPNLGAGSPVPQ